jgi:hypothetical protein
VLPGTAKCPEPLCPFEELPLQGWYQVPPGRALPLLRRSYGLMRQTKTLPPTLALTSSGGSLQVATSLCWEMVLPDVISASLSPGAWTPTPAVSVVHLPVSSHRTSAFPEKQRVGLPQVSAPRLPSGHVFEVAVIPLRSGPRFCLPPRSLLPPWSHHEAAVALTPEQSTRRYLHVHRVC